MYIRRSGTERDHEALKASEKGAFGGFSGLNCLGMTSEKAKAKRLMLWDEKELC